MNPYFTAMLPLVGIIIGLVAKPIQDWIQIKLNRNNDVKNKKEKLIEEVFMLLPAINEKLYDLNHLVIQRIIGAEFTKSPYNHNQYSNAISRIKCVLKLELSTPENIWKIFDDFENHINDSMYVIIHELASKAGLAPETNPLNQVIQQIVQKHDGDHKKVAATISQEAKSKAKILINAIEEFLKKEKRNLK